MSAWQERGGPWLPGMRGANNGETFLVLPRMTPDGTVPVVLLIERYQDGAAHEPPVISLPPRATIDETDGPTVGAMKEHVRELRDDPLLHASWWSATKQWRIWDMARPIGEGPTEAVAWAAALPTPTPA